MRHFEWRYSDSCQYSPQLLSLINSSLFALCSTFRFIWLYLSLFSNFKSDSQPFSMARNWFLSLSNGPTVCEHGILHVFLFFFGSCVQMNAMGKKISLSHSKLLQLLRCISLEKNVAQECEFPNGKMILWHFIVNLFTDTQKMLNRKFVNRKLSTFFDDVQMFNAHVPYRIRTKNERKTFHRIL